MTLLPADFKTVSDEAWRRVCATPGYLAEREARFLILAAACAPATGAIVEIGSFKGRATVAGGCDGGSLERYPVTRTGALVYVGFSTSSQMNRATVAREIIGGMAIRHRKFS